MKHSNFRKIRPYLALVGACLYQFAALGTFINSHGVYMAKIRETTGLSMTAIASTSTIRSISGAVLASVLTMLFYKRNQCAVMFLSLVSILLGYLALIVTTDNFLWYLAPILLAPVSSVTILAVPHVLLEWFPKRSGTAAGIAMAFSGLGGAVCNPAAAALCESVGWQWTIVIMAAISLVMGCAGLYLMFILKGTAEEAETDESGKTGGSAVKVEGIRASVAVRFVLCEMVVLFATASSMVANISMHMQELGFSLAVGASITSAVMVGNIGGKVIFGWLSDKIGIWKSVLIISFLVGVGALVFGVNRNAVGLMYVGGLFFGTCYFCGTIGIAKCSLAAYGSELTKKYSGIHAGINSAVGAALAFLAGPVYDSVGSFRPVFIFVAVVCAMSFAAAMMMVFLSGKGHKPE